MNVKEAILRLSRLKLNLQNAWQFYRANADTYETLAKQIAHGVLIATPPPDVTAEQWARTTDTLVERIGAFLVANSKVNGLVLRLATETIGTGQNTGEFVPGASNVTVADIVRWVDAGREGDPDGKRLDDRDYGKSNQQIAFNILYAVRQGRGNGVIDYVQKFAGVSQQNEAHDRSPQILTAWLDIIVPRVRADLEAWVRTQIALK